MKNSIKLLIAFVSVLSFSCTEDVQDTGNVTPDSSLRLLVPNSSFNIIVDGTKLDNLATTFVWNDRNNPPGGSITYTVEAALSGTDFAMPVTLGTTSEHFLDVTVRGLDTAAKDMGLEPMAEGLIDVRVNSGSGTSNSYTIKVTPYQPNWGIIGSATPLGWDNSTPMNYNPNTGTYSISFGFTTGEFKFRLDNSWTTNYGDDGNDLSLEANGANIPITAGNYTVVADFTNHNYTVTPIPDAWGIIGDATPTGWGSDTLMDYNATTGKYSIIMRMNVGSFKFRLNHDWGTNYGDDGNDLTLDNGGSNIPITAAGTYLITVDFTGLTYTISQL